MELGFQFTKLLFIKTKPDENYRILEMFHHSKEKTLTFKHISL